MFGERSAEAQDFFHDAQEGVWEVQLGEDALAGPPGSQPSGEALLRGQWCPYPDDGASVLSSSCARL
jgi:hypothetical protein